MLIYHYISASLLNVPENSMGTYQAHLNYYNYVVKHKGYIL